MGEQRRLFAAAATADNLQAVTGGLFQEKKMRTDLKKKKKRKAVWPTEMKLPGDRVEEKVR